MLKPYDELVKVDVSQYCDKRDGLDYLNWAKCIKLLRLHGAETVYFLPVPNPKTGGSLYFTDEYFESGQKKNRCYETRIEIHIDDKVFYMQSPVMNGANPVQDNSMTQQRVWNSMCRSFVKGVAIHTGLGFNLWCNNEDGEEQASAKELDIWQHSYAVLKKRLEEGVSARIKEGIPLEEIAHRVGYESGDVLKSKFALFNELSHLEKQIYEMKK